MKAVDGLVPSPEFGGFYEFGVDSCPVKVAQDRHKLQICQLNQLAFGDDPVPIGVKQVEYDLELVLFNLILPDGLLYLLLKTVKRKALFYIVPRAEEAVFPNGFVENLYLLHCIADLHLHYQRQSIRILNSIVLSTDWLLPSLYVALMVEICLTDAYSYPLHPLQLPP